MIKLLEETIGELPDWRPMLKSRLFWGATGCVILIAIADLVLEKQRLLIDDSMLYFIPITLFWLPVSLATLSFGVAGGLATNMTAVLASLPNWLLWQEAGHIQEMALVSIMVLISFLVGWQVDGKKAAQERARSFSAYSVHNQEQVFQRLSLDIHDEPLQTLMAVCHRLDVMNNSATPNGELGKMRKDVEQVARELRSIIRNLRPSILEDLGLVPAVRQLLTDFAARTGTTYELRVTGEAYRLPSESEIHVFRIAQEALNNVERHALAQKATVAMDFLSKELRMAIADDGIGFDPAHLQKDLIARNHYGIMGMMERAELVHGKIKIESNAGHGTTITVHVPASADPQG